MARTTGTWVVGPVLDLDGESGLNPSVVRTELHARLDVLRARYDLGWLHADPLRWPRRYPDPGDREVAALLAACLAYGRVASIHRALAKVFEALGPHPARAAMALPAALARRLADVSHRWTRGEDLAWLLAAAARIRRRHGSLGAVVAGAAVSPEPLRNGLAALRDALLADGGRIPADRRRARAFLVPDPRGGAACKRLLLLARWCVRPDDGVDLGLWKSPRLGPADLLVPLDVHVHRTALDLGLTRRKQADWRAAEEVTAALRAFAPEDPTRYDFALARPGIAGRCRHRWVEEICTACELVTCCRAATPSGSRSRRRGLRTRPSRRPSS